MLFTEQKICILHNEYRVAKEGVPFTNVLLPKGGYDG